MRIILNQIFILLTILFFNLNSFVLAKPPLTIYHAFDMQSAQVYPLLKKIKAQNYDAIQLPPQQISDSGNSWDLVYRPRNYDIENTQTYTDLQTLIKAADQEGILIIVDVVFNHTMGLYPKEQWYSARGEILDNMFEALLNKLNYTDNGLKVAHFQRNSFHEPKAFDESTFDSVRTTWIGLPDLNQKEEYVWNIHKRHLDLLINAGVKGFRFDAAKHIFPEDYKRYVDFIFEAWHKKDNNVIPFIYGEVLNGRNDYPDKYILYSNTIKKTYISDDSLLTSLKKAFAINENISDILATPSTQGSSGVSYARTHDTVKAGNNYTDITYLIHSPAVVTPELWDRIRETLTRNAELAWAYVLGRNQGPVLVFSDNKNINISDTDSNIVKTGVMFRRILADNEGQCQDSSFQCHEYVHKGLGLDEANILFMTRGNLGFLLINKSGTDYYNNHITFSNTPLSGCYKELRTGVRFFINHEQNNVSRIDEKQHSLQDGLFIQKRDALFFVHTLEHECRIQSNSSKS